MTAGSDGAVHLELRTVVESVMVREWDVLIWLGDGASLRVSDSIRIQTEGGVIDVIEPEAQSAEDRTRLVESLERFLPPSRAVELRILERGEFELAVRTPAAVLRCGPGESYEPWEFHSTSEHVVSLPSGGLVVFPPR